MKNLTTILISLILISFTATAQTGFTIEYAGGGPLHTIDLSNAQKTFVGNTLNNFGAGDFGANEVFYAINSDTDEFYEIDTLTGSNTLIGSITPPTDHMWTGMAYDEANDIMYGYSAYAVASGEGSLHIIDVSTGSYTLVGTQTTATAIGCIAIDGSGQMFGMQLSASAKIYQIDITNGSVTLIGNTGQGAAGMGHGMDWCNANQTMYLTTYNSSTFANTLRTVNLTTGSTAQVGGLLGMWTGVIAIPGSVALSASFSADVTDVCTGGVVNYTDQSSGDATSWSWTFEGGTPATSTNQNPAITYNTTGTFDVTLEVSDGTYTDTDYEEDMITVIDIPAQPNTPVGETATCGNEEYVYTTESVQYADSYVWEVSPSDAGTLTSNDLTATLLTSDIWYGDFTIKVRATNQCGTGIWSSELSCTMSFTPLSYYIQGGGGYCEGGSGNEVTLTGSQTGADYELFLEDVSTGIILAGTGNPLSFGYQTDEGTYTVTGFSATCTTLMLGEAYISIIYPPEAGTLPTGPVEVCPNTTTDYQTLPITGADILIWTLDPSDAGTIIGSGENISIEWSAIYNGATFLSVYGSNDCGDGDPSDDLEINLSQLPQPEVVGDTLVCKDRENIYSTIDNPGSTYSWEVEGGNISSGAGTSEIIILWTTVGSGTVLVTETSAETCEGTSNTLQIAIDDCTEIDETFFKRVKLFPNPAKNNISIAFTTANSTAYKVSIYNQLGQLVYNTRAVSAGGQGSHQIDVTSLPNGLYFIKMINSSNQVYQTRFEIVR